MFARVFPLLVAASILCITTQAAEPLNTTALSAGQSHALVLRSDGTVWSWGTNRIGEAGLGNVSLVLSPRRITSLTNVVSVSAGPLHSLAASGNGLVWSWGTNGNGRLGDGTGNNASTPVQVSFITNGLAVSAGATHSLALLSDGRVMAWGANNGGQLGTGNTTATNQPIQVPTLTNIVAVAAGSNFSVALTAAGEVWSWGTNAQGQLGLGHNTTQLSPVKITTLSGIAMIAAGSAHALALDSNGVVYAWGRNAEGQIGDGTTSNVNAPMPVPSLGPANNLGAARQIAANFVSSAAVTVGGKLCYWGWYGNGVTNTSTLQPVVLGAGIDESFTKVAYGDAFLLATQTDGDVWAWGKNNYGQWGNGTLLEQWFGATYEAVNPSFVFSSRPYARTSRFNRGYRPTLAYNSFVLPLGLDKGVELGLEGSELYNYDGQAPWFLRTAKTPVDHTLRLTSGTTNLTRLSVENPIVAFGSEAGGSALYTGQPYSFGIYAGAFDEKTSETNLIRIKVYDRAALAGGTNNVAPTNTFTVGLPRRFISADNAIWANFIAKGSRIVSQTNGLRTVVEFADTPGIYAQWGLSWLEFGGQLRPATNVVLGGYRVTHIADSTNYCYVIEVKGSSQVATNTMAPFATNSSGWAYTPMYAVGFDEFPQWRARFIDRIHFEGIPLPPAYAGRRVSELNGLTAVVTNSIWLTNTPAYTNLDTTPELRQHPVLDQFVEEMGRNPLALTSYVINEIELVDPIALSEASKKVADSVEIGGVNRSALGVFLEGQGSPTEQCALLVYLLRKAGYSAGYVFPTNNNLRLLDTRISQLWQTQVKGLIWQNGMPVVTNNLIIVNYPWVVANIGTNTIQIFPWLKDTEIVEGGNVYDYMPTNHHTAYDWARDFVMAEPALMSLAPVNSSALTFWQRYLQNVLNTNVHETNLSLDDFGVRAFNRRRSFPTWNSLPLPNFLTNQTQVVTVPTLSESAVTYPFLTNIFDRIRIEVYKDNPNTTANRIIDTGDWRACDFHNRKLMLYTNNTDNVALWLAAYRPGLTNSSNFADFETGTNSLNPQLLTGTAGSGVTYLVQRITYKRRAVTLASPSYWLPMSEHGGGPTDFYQKKADVSAWCLSIGRVTPEMMRVHADEYWRLQQQRAVNPNFAPAKTDDVGTAAMLLATGYLAQRDREEEVNAKLHKVRSLTRMDFACAHMTPLANGNMQIALDCRWNIAALVGNASMRQDSGDSSIYMLNNYFIFNELLNSSAEHNILHTMFGDNGPISTVRVLQIVAERARANGTSMPLELNIKNYQTMASGTYSGYGPESAAFQDYNGWANVYYQYGVGFDTNFVKTIIVPGLVTIDNASFHGSAAMFFTRFGGASLLNKYNGGLSSATLSWMGSATFSSYDLAYDLQQSPTFGYSFVHNNLSTPQVHFNFSTYDWAAYGSSEGFEQALIQFTPQQEVQGVTIVDIMNMPTNTLAPQAIKMMKDLGIYGPPDDAEVVQSDSLVADPVHVVSGSFYVNATDLTLLGPLPLELRRNYLSRNVTENHFGHGWKLGFTPWLVPLTNAQNQDVLLAAEPNGAVIAFGFQSNNLWTVTAENNPTLVNHTESGDGGLANHFNSRIEHYTTNGLLYVLSSVDGSKRYYEEKSFTIFSGTNLLNRTRPYLTRWEDHAGNHHLFYYGTNSAANDYGQLNRVESANGSILSFKYDFFGRITEALTDDNRRVTYRYDDYGDLVAVTLPDSSQWEYEYRHDTFTTNSQTYTYSTHLLTRETKPDGRVLANTYDNLRRVTVQAATVGTNRELVTNAWFYYTNNCDSLSTHYLTGTTRVEDVFHNPTLYHYTSNLITRIEEPLGRTTIKDWFETGETNKAGWYPRSIEKIVNARGLTNEFQYSVSGNVTNRIISGDLTGEGGIQFTTNSFSYSANHLLLTVQIPSGNQLTYYYEDAVDSYRPTRVESSSGGVGISTNRFVYGDMAEVVAVGKTNRAYGLLLRAVAADSATNEWSYNGRGFVTQSVRYARTAEDAANTDPAVTNYFSYSPRGDLFERMDAAGRIYRKEHDSMGRLLWQETVTETGNSLAREHFYYNRNGDLEWYDGPRTGPEDYIWFDYDGAGRKVQEIHWRSRAKVDGSGVEAETGDNLYATTHYAYDGFGNLTRFVNPRGAVTTNLWDSLGRLVQQKSYDLDGSTVLSLTGYSYEPGGWVQSFTNALGGVSAMFYTATGQLRRQEHADGSTNGWTYHLDGRLNRATLSNGAYWQNIYDDASRKITRIFHSAVGTPLATNITEFDRRGNPIIYIDAAGFGSTNRFDGLGRVKSWVGPQITQTVLEGAPTPPGGTALALQQGYTNYFDAAGVVMTNVNALGEKAIAYTDALGRVTRAEIRTSANVLVRETSAAYAADHHSVTITQGSGASAIASTTYTDNDGRNVLSLLYPAANAWHFTVNDFDMAGNLAFSGQYARTNSAVTQFTSAFYDYDGLNRLAEKTDRDGALTTYSYDGAGNLVQQIVPGGLQWLALYNSAGQMFTNWNASGGGSVVRANGYTYYGNGHAWAGLLATHTDARGVVLTCHYDDYLRPTTNAFTGSLDEQNLTTIWKYDLRGLMTNIVEKFASTATGPNLTLNRSYNAYGQLIREDAGFGTNGLSSSHNYDSAGRRQSLDIGSFGYNFVWRADGALTNVNTSRGKTFYIYDTAGWLTNRTAESRSTKILTRDGAGRPLTVETKVNGSVELTETLAYTGDGLIAAHTLDRSALLDERQFAYASQSRRLMWERLDIDGSTTWTNTFTFDAGTSQGAGVLTRINQPGGADWNAHMDDHLRVDRETNNVVRRLAFGRVNMQPNFGFATIGIKLNDRSVPFLTLGNSDTNWPTRWQAQIELLPGTHTLTASAVHPSKLYTNTASVTFTNAAVDQTTLSYYSEGQLTSRVWKNSSGVTNRVQTFQWDAKGRLHRFTERDANGDGHDWKAVYDAFGRRWQTQTVPTTNSVAITNQFKTFTQAYDPHAEFLELGVHVDGRWSWKIHGPDMNGVYGGMNGLGGWDAVVTGPDVFYPLVQDVRANILGAFDPESSAVKWSDARVTGYGSIAGHRPLSLGEGASLWEAGAWRGKYPELSGLYNLGARYYDPVAGRFLSPDPFGHDSDPSLYSAFNGDAINYFDPDGRYAKRFVDDVVQRVEEKGNFDNTPAWTHPISATVGVAHVALENMGGFFGWVEHKLGIPPGGLGMLPMVGPEMAIARSSSTVPRLTTAVSTVNQERALIAAVEAPQVVKAARAESVVSKVVPEPLSSVASPKLLTQGNRTTLTLKQVRNLRGEARWRAAEQYVQELHGASPQRRFSVPTTGGRVVDAPVEMLEGVMANEVKMYQSWRTIGKLPKQQTVPLTEDIAQQVLKDVWLRRNVPGYDPRWMFLDAPPSPELARFLSERGISYVIYH